MSYSDSDNLQRAIERATELVKNVPEDLRPVAFSKAFDALLGTGGSGTNTGSQPQKAAASRSRSRTQTNTLKSGDLITEQLNTLDSTKHPDISSRLSVRDNALRVLKAAREDLNIEWLSVPQILTTLKDKFRVTVNRPALNMALSRAGRLVDRRKQGDAFLYRIMAAGEEALLEVPTDETHSRPVRMPTRPTRLQSSTLPRRSAETAETRSAKPRTAASKRPGPKEVLEQLIVERYFDTPKKIGDIVAHIEVKRAHKYKTTDLSPTLIRLQREQKLDRERNADGQYEYQRHPKNA